MKDHSIFASIALANALLFSPFSTLAQTAEDLPPHVTAYSHSEAPNDHVSGSKDAATTMIVWASVTCPHCGDWFSTEWPLVKSELVETGKLRFIFREFPTAPPELSMTGFRLANCAPTADYMSIIEYQMEQQQEIFQAAQDGLAPEIYREIAKMGGMETDEAISTCLSNPDITANIKDNVDRATLANISGVPAFLINGQPYKDKQDAQSLIKLINEMDEAARSTQRADTASEGENSKSDQE